MYTRVHCAFVLYLHVCMPELGTSGRQRSISINTSVEFVESISRLWLVKRYQFDDPVGWNTSVLSLISTWRSIIDAEELETYSVVAESVKWTDTDTFVACVALTELGKSKESSKFEMMSGNKGAKDISYFLSNFDHLYFDHLCLILNYILL